MSSVKAVDVDQNLAVTASRDRTLKVWSLVEFREIDSTLGNYFSLDVCYKKMRLAYG